MPDGSGFPITVPRDTVTIKNMSFNDLVATVDVKPEPTVESAEMRETLAAVSRVIQKIIEEEFFGRTQDAQDVLFLGTWCDCTVTRSRMLVHD